MLKKTIILLCVVMMSLNACSQSDNKTKKSPQEIAIEKTSEMKKQLGLNEKQAEMVKTALLTRINTVQTQKKTIRDSEKTIKKAIREYKEKLNTILTDDQQKKLAEIRKQNKVNKEGEKNKKK